MKLRPETQADNNTENTPDYNALSAAVACSHTYVPRENTGGNFCEHYPENPRFVLKTNPFKTGANTDDLGDKRRSAILYDTCERIKNYYYEPNAIPVFNTANRHKRKSERQRNSARREAMIALSTVMVMNMDLHTFKVGFPTKDGFVCRSLEWLAEKAKLSYSRAKRAMSDLVASGIITSYQYRELLNAERKEYKFHVAIRTFQIAFFDLLGISRTRLNKARDYAENKLAQNARKLGVDKKIMAMLQLGMSSITNRVGATMRDQHTAEDKEAVHSQAKAAAKRRTQIVLEVMQNKPELRDNPEALEIAIHQQLRAEGLHHGVLNQKE